jgi:uridine kinase
MYIKLIGISGGTGVGKSTLCTALLNKYPEKIGLVQLDDYFRPAKEVPKMKEYENYDHPDALYLDKLYNDLLELSKGNRVTINTKNERLNPEYKKTSKRIPVVFSPKPIILVEGFLALHDERIRNLFDVSVWLDVGHDTRWSRRIHFKSKEYEQEVLIPMHEKYAEPTRQYADHIINVSDLNPEQVLEKVEQIILL